MCHAVRALGSKLTVKALTLAGSPASIIVSCHTVPVKYSEDAFLMAEMRLCVFANSYLIKVIKDYDTLINYAEVFYIMYF